MDQASGLIWAAGFLEGEGSFYINRGYPTVAAKQVNREPLERLRDLYGGSMNLDRRLRVLRDPIHQLNSKPIWEWRLSGHRALELALALAPLMSQKRREQIEGLIGEQIIAPPVSRDQLALLV